MKSCSPTHKQFKHSYFTSTQPTNKQTKQICISTHLRFLCGDLFWTCNRKQWDCRSNDTFSCVFASKRSIQMSDRSSKHASCPLGWLAGHDRGWNSPCSLNSRFIQPLRLSRGVKGAAEGTVFSHGKMAGFSPVLTVGDAGGRFAQPIFPRSRSGSESESELSQSLARTKIRSYGSTASVTASLGERYVEHRVTDSDTLQGIALKYGVTVS